MFISDPICILTAGKTVDGREISQQVINDMAENYDPNVYSARIRKNQDRFSESLGSVASLEKHGNKLYAVLKPNSKLLQTVELGQRLHTACEYLEEFSDTGKAYLTGLVLTDNPSSLGTTQIHLSTMSDNNAQILQSNVLKMSSFHKEEDQISVIKYRIAALSDQVENLTMVANTLQEGQERELDEDTYL